MPKPKTIILIIAGIIILALLCLGTVFFCFFLLTKTPVAEAGMAQNISDWA